MDSQLSLLQQVCRYCGESKSVDEFYASTGAKWCKPCYIAYQMAKKKGVAPAPKVWADPDPLRCVDCGVVIRRGLRCAACWVAAGRHVPEVRTCWCGVEFTSRSRAHRSCSKVCSTKASSVRRLFGLAPEDYAALIAAAGGCCQMCGLPFKECLGFSPAKWTHHIDHCHETGRVRGLLCATCNVSLGKFEKYRDLAEGYLARATLDLRDQCLR